MNLMMLGVGAIVCFSPALQGQDGEPIARIGDQPVYEEDLIPSISGPLLLLRNQEFEIKSKALAILINQRLLREEAKRAGLGPAQFLQERVDAQVAAPTDDEVKAYYESHKDSFNRPFEEVKAQLPDTLKQIKTRQAREEYAAQLRRKAGVSILLRPPEVDVPVDPLRLRGNPNAPITIVEFADFQCPSCQEAEQTIRKLLDKYGDKVRLSYRDFPLRPIHPHAQLASEASRCAGEQGRYWEYHDLLFASSGKLAPEQLNAYAKTAGLDEQKFQACLSSGKFTSSVENDVQSGLGSGVSSTPTFFVNGQVLIGTQPLSAFEDIISAKLASAVPKASR